MNTDTIVRRIIELKKVSVELKQSTENPTFTNTNFVKNILKFGKEISPSMISSLNKTNHFNTYKNYHDKSKDKFHWNNSEDNSSLNNSKQIEKFDQNGSLNLRDSSKIIYQQYQGQYLAPIEQINELKTENTDLEQEILLLNEKLKKLEDIEKQEMEEQWKDGIPYFVLRIPKIQIFHTRLTISEKDYNKIDYKLYSVDLNLEKVLFSQIPQINSINNNLKTFSLCISDLTEVNYHSPPNVTLLPFTSSYSREIKNQEFLVIYHFKCHKNEESKIKNKKPWKSSFSRNSDDRVKYKDENHEIIDTIYMKFENEEEFKEWDLGFFINFRIMEDFNKNETKNDNFSSMSNNFEEFDLEFSPRSKPKSNESNYRNIQNKKTQKSTDKIEEKSDHQPTKIQEKKSLTIEEYFNDDDFKETSIEIQKLNSNIDKTNNEIILIPQNNKEYNNIKIKDEIESPLKEENSPSSEADRIKERSDTSHFGTFVSQEDKKLQEEQYKHEKEEEIIKRKVLELTEQKKKDEEKVAAMKKTEMELSFKRAKETLKKGYFLVKYARMSVSPHDKRVFLSDDGKRLCWEEAKNPKESKYIFICDIESIKQGYIGKETESYYLKDRSLEKGCYVTIHLTNKERKTLELSAKDEFTMEEFCKDLQIYRKKIF